MNSSFDICVSLCVITKSPSRESPSAWTGEAAGIGAWTEGRVPGREGVDPTNFQELTKLQTPKTPAVAIVQHTGQPPGKESLKV